MNYSKGFHLSIETNIYCRLDNETQKFLDVNDLSSTTVPSILHPSHSKITTCKNVTKAVGQGSTNQQNYTLFSHGFCLIVQTLSQHCKTYSNYQIKVSNFIAEELTQIKNCSKLEITCSVPDNFQNQSQ